MTLGHIGSLDHDAVRVLQISRINRNSASTQPRSQTGNTWAVSDACLVLNGNHSQASHQLLLEVVPFVVQGCASKSKDSCRMINQRAIFQAFDERIIAGLFYQFSYAIHRPIKTYLIPILCTGLSMKHAPGTITVVVQLQYRSAFGAQTALAVGTLRIALDI